MKNILEKKQEGIGMQGKGKYTFTIRDAKTKAIKRVYEYYNLIPTVARENLARGLAGGISSLADISVNESSLGTGVTPPANGDTTLQTEVHRTGIGSSTFVDNKYFATAFYTAPEVSGTFKEAGLHINGTGAPDSGLLFSRVVIDITKSLSETLTIDYEVTIS